MRPRLIRYVPVLLCELFTLSTIAVVYRQPSRLLLASVTVILILLPELLQRLLHCRICNAVYLFALFYAIGPMLGHCYNFYFRIPYWDKLLHVIGGIMFVILGQYLFSVVCADTRKRLACGIFALCFSIAISVLWEFFEFGMDQLFGMDMQSDSVITSITSYILVPTAVDPETIGGITSVSVNGQILPIHGYLDIGLLDTMADMLLESAGALVTTALFWLDRGRHPLVIQT